MPRKNANFRSSTNEDECKVYTVEKNGVQMQASVLQRRPNEVYVHYAHTDKRMDEWRPQEDVIELDLNGSAPPSVVGRKRRRGSSTMLISREGSVEGQSAAMSGINGRDGIRMTEEELDLREHRKITAKRNFDRVNFGHWLIKTWYYSPYPLSDAEAEELALLSAIDKASPQSGSSRIHNVNRASLRAHGRTSDLLAGGLGRDNATGGKATLWVCDRCFKYMREGLSWELHMKTCQVRHPPGRKVYQRGAHIIWEVDGAKEKLFCQNLSLFGKLFIDIKTLFFDCDNFLFYLLTDADSQRDHVLGFFSKEKVSYDDYNLACIVILPPYQRKGYGMLLIEFSYELSRRAGKFGTPERPLSDLGLRSYLTYWIATVVRFFRRILSVVPSEVPKSTSAASQPDPDLLRFISQEADDGVHKNRRRRGRGKSSEVGINLNSFEVDASTSSPDDLIFSALRHTRTTSNPDGSATTHVMVMCTLEDISNATHIRVEDVAFALHESGLLTRRKQLNGEGNMDEIIVISRELVEAVAVERVVKRMCMEVQHVLF